MTKEDVKNLSKEVKEDKRKLKESEALKKFTKQYDKTMKGLAKNE